MGKLSLYLLGDLRIELDGKLVETIATEKARALLVYLAIEGGRPLRRDVLAELLWPERPPGVGRASLRQAIGNLRLALGDRDAPSPFILTQRDHIQLNPSQNVWIDTIAVSDLIQNVRDHGHQQGDSCHACESRLTKAIDLYKGDFLADYSLPDTQGFSEWATIQREAAHRQVTNALRLHVSLLETRGARNQACRQARKLVSHEPWSESNHRCLMRLLAITGKQTEALHQYTKCQNILKEEFGATAAEDTHSLYQQIKDGQIEELIATPIALFPDIESDTTQQIPTWLRFAAIGTASVAFVGLLGLSLRSLTEQRDYQSDELPLSGQVQARLPDLMAPIDPTELVELRAFAPMTPSSQSIGSPLGMQLTGNDTIGTPTPIPYHLSLVVMGENNNPVENARVSIVGMANSVSGRITDKGGQADWTDLPSNEVNLRISAPSYYPAERSEVIERGPNLVTIILERDPFGLLPEEACGPNEEVLYIEDFQDGTTSRWLEFNNTGFGFEIVPRHDETDDWVVKYSGGEPAIAELQGLAQSNVAWRTHILTSYRGVIQFNWRVESIPYDTDYGQVMDSRYILALHDATLLNRVAIPIWDVLAFARDFQLSTGIWHRLEIGHYEGDIEVWIDGNRILTYSDPYPLPEGERFIWFNDFPEGTYVYIDDISLCELSGPFIPLTTLYQAE